MMTHPTETFRRQTTLDRMRQRLRDGQTLIDDRRAAGHDVTRLQAFWNELRDQYRTMLASHLAAEARPCDKCPARIIFRYTPAGARMPLNIDILTDPVPGAYVLDGDELCLPVAPMIDPPEPAYFMNHWATCPKADQFKTPRKARKETTA